MSVDSVIGYVEGYVRYSCCNYVRDDVGDYVRHAVCEYVRDYA